MTHKQETEKIPKTSKTAKFEGRYVVLVSEAGIEKAVVPEDGIVVFESGFEIDERTALARGWVRASKAK